jgi:tetratricopeptide (TPR) repeat protein
MLAHQSFIQFLRGHIPNPPTWIREGFGIYFNSLTYDPQEQVLRYEENLAWLDTVKGLGINLLYPRQILLADTMANSGTAGQYSRNLQICSWAFVSFLLYSEEHYRTLTESFMVLSSHNTAEENSLAVTERFSLWTDFSVMDREYADYLDSRKTFTELIAEGRRYYDSGNAETAELYFLAASDLRPAHYAPYYYLGLLYFDANLYDAAEGYYLLALEHGADQALVSYALGINAVSAGNNNAARTWLERAAALDPARYRTRAQDLIQRLR